MTPIPIVLYGIPNCDTVRKARAWLDAHAIAYEFVDFKKTPPGRAQVGQWVAALGIEMLLNRRGTTWRRLEATTQALAATESGVVGVLMAHPSAIRRPIVEAGAELIAGFDEARYAHVLAP